MKEIPLGLTFDDVLIQPRHSSIKSRSDVDTKSYLAGLELKVPIIASPMDTVCEWEMAQTIRKLGGFGFIHRYMTVDEQCAQLEKAEPGIEDYRWGQPIKHLGAAIGLSDCSGDFERLKGLVHAGIRHVCLDVAYGDNDHIIKAVKTVKERYPFISLTAGNVTSIDGFRNLVIAGADAIRVGIGGGSACSTRVRTGIGVPQLSAILECAEVAKHTNVALIADGGIRGPADIAKALGAGADLVMCGNLLAGASESPGSFKTDPITGIRYKFYRGMASKEAQMTRQIKMGLKPNEDGIYSEGEVGKVRWTGPLENTIEGLMKGLRSAFSYVGARNLKEFHEYVEFIRITHAGMIESYPHDIEI